MKALLLIVFLSSLTPAMANTQIIGGISENVQFDLLKLDLDSMDECTQTFYREAADPENEAVGYYSKINFFPKGRDESSVRIYLIFSSEDSCSSFFDMFVARAFKSILGGEGLNDKVIISGRMAFRVSRQNDPDELLVDQVEFIEE